MSRASNTRKAKSRPKEVKKTRISRRPAYDNTVEARAISSARRTTAAMSNSVLAAFSALGHRARVLILCRLQVGMTSHGELVRLTRIAVGPLYHHLSQLRMAQLISLKQRNEYKITELGRKFIKMAKKFGPLLRKK